jgi:hypothetical protein
MSIASPFISQGARDSLRARSESAMLSRCDIIRYVPGPPNLDNSPGDATEQRQSGIACRFTEALLRGAEDLANLRLTGEARFSMRVPLGTDVLTSDVIELGGRQYEIVSDNINRTQVTSINLNLRLIA